MTLLLTTLLAMLAWTLGPALLVARRWTRHFPMTGLVLLLADVVVAVASLVAVCWRTALLGTAPGSLTGAFVRAARLALHGHPLEGMGFSKVVALTIGADLAVVTLAVWLQAELAHVRTRRRQRAVLDVVADPADVVRLPHEVPVAFFLPGRGGRVVLSSALEETCTADELDAIVAHERGHQRGAHGAVLVAASALEAGGRFLPSLGRMASELRTLTECCADDTARRRGLAGPLERALRRLGECTTSPTGALASNDRAVAERCARLYWTVPVRVDPLVAAGAALGAVALVAAVVR